MSIGVIKKGLTANIVGGLPMDIYYGIKQHSYNRLKDFILGW